MTDRTKCRHWRPTVRSEKCSLMEFETSPEVCRGCKWHQTQEEYQRGLARAEEILAAKGLRPRTYRAENGVLMRGVEKIDR